ncbi:hypothetical protein HBI05_175370 [Parastagonospora nodorum]|nr:hypothetical protein HBI05_175370 [Parastagonospora nodorum]
MSLQAGTTPANARLRGTAHHNRVDEWSWAVGLCTVAGSEKTVMKRKWISAVIKWSVRASVVADRGYCARAAGDACAAERAAVLISR